MAAGDVNSPLYVIPSTEAPAPASGTITTQNLQPTGTATPNSAVEVDVEGFNNIIFAITGTYTGALGLYGTINGVTWSPLTVGLLNVGTASIVSGLSLGSATVGTFLASVLGFKKVRLHATNAITGSATVTIIPDPAVGIVHIGSMPQLSLGPSANAIGSISGVTPGTTASSLGKAEDASHVSGDTGVAVWGVRVPTTPASPTSAAGDYGAMAITSEGKTVIAGRGAEEHQWQGTATANSTVSDVSLKAAAGANVRNYITDIIISNTSGSPTTCTIKDGTTAIMGPINVPAGAVVAINLGMPLKGSPNTALQIASSASVSSLIVSATGYVGV